MTVYHFQTNLKNLQFLYLWDSKLKEYNQVYLILAKITNKYMFIE